MPERLDWFSATILTGEAGMDDKTRELITSHAEMFLRSQGTISWSEWQLLGAVSRTAFLEAAEKLDRERAVRTADLVLRALEEASRPEGVEECPGG